MRVEPHEHAEYRGAAGQRRGQHGIVVRQVGRQFFQVELHPEIPVQALAQQIGRTAVRLGQQNIQGHGGRAVLGQIVDKPGHQVAGPGPLAVCGQAFFVDVHHHGRIRGRRRLPGGQEKIVYFIVELPEQGGLQQVQQQHQAADSQAGQQGQGRAPQGRMSG